MIATTLLLLVGLPLLAHGAEGLYHTLRSRTQAQVSCEQFLQQRPPSRWLRITGCEVDYVRAAYRERQGRIRELFFPVRPAGASPAEPAALVVSTTDPEVLAVAQQTIGGGTRADQEAFLVMMLRIVTMMKAAREVEGSTRSTVEMLRARRDLAGIQAPLRDDFAVLDLHRRPTVLFPAVEAAAGAGAVLLAVVTAVAARRAAARTRPPLPAGPALPEPHPSADAAPLASPVVRPDLRRLMLLNLPPDAATAEIDGAPPLGAQAAVRDAVAGVLPGIRFDERCRAEVSQPDHLIRLDLGSTSEVWTIVVDATGDGAPQALRRLVTATGWRLYAPRLGRFIATAELQ